jgi:hypothetical protein
MVIIADDIEVRLKIINKPPMLAQAEVIIGTNVETKGWRVLQSVKGKLHPRFQEPLWVQPPCYRAGKQYKPLVYINDKKLYEAIENKIYNAYFLKRQEFDKSIEYNQLLEVSKSKYDTI